VGSRSLFLCAPAGRRNWAHTYRSVKHVFFVELDAMRAERAQEFGLEVFGLVMLGLPLDVSSQRVFLGFADGKYAVTLLPRDGDFRAPRRSEWVAQSRQGCGLARGRRPHRLIHDMPRPASARRGGQGRALRAPVGLGLEGPGHGSMMIERRGCGTPVKVGDSSVCAQPLGELPRRERPEYPLETSGSRFQETCRASTCSNSISLCASGPTPGRRVATGGTCSFPL
jgi:hypothetical protein